PLDPVVAVPGEALAHFLGGKLRQHAAEHAVLHPRLPRTALRCPTTVTHDDPTRNRRQPLAFAGGKNQSIEITRLLGFVWFSGALPDRDAGHHSKSAREDRYMITLRSTAAAPAPAVVFRPVPI